MTDTDWILLLVCMLGAAAFTFGIERLISWDVARRMRRIRESDERFARLILSELAPLNRLRLPQLACPSCGAAPGMVSPGGMWKCLRCGGVHDTRRR